MQRDRSLIPLSHQHHNGLVLCVLTRRSLAQDRSPANISLLARRVIDRYELELVNHFEIEEQLVFPLCGPTPFVESLVAEHRAIEALIPPLRTVPSVDLLEQFCQLLSSHIRREESELFEQIQRTLPGDVLDRIGEEIDRRVVRVCL
jgi:iron-sulfur cluster repair protein YtfE (RIC family)